MTRPDGHRARRPVRHALQRAVRPFLAALLLALPAGAAAGKAQPLSLAARQALFRAVMAGELEIARQVNDPLILAALRQEGSAAARQGGQASLACSVTDRIEALNRRQEPLREKLYADLQKRFKVARPVIEAVLAEGQKNGWRY